MTETFTRAQTLNLLLLLRRKAIGEAKAVSIYDEQKLNPVVIGKLRDKGLAESKVQRRGRGHQFTVYWLTPAGEKAAKKVRKPTSGSSAERKR